MARVRSVGTVSPPRHGNRARGMPTESPGFRPGLLCVDAVNFIEAPGGSRGIRSTATIWRCVASSLTLRACMLAIALAVLPEGVASAADGEPVLERCLVSLMEEAKVVRRGSD